MIYADDTQIYVTFKNGDSDDAKASIEACVEEIRQWMKDNKLALNEGKTEVIQFHNKNLHSFTPLDNLNIGNASVQPSSTVRDLGLYLDSPLSMSAHVSKICKSAS